MLNSELNRSANNKSKIAAWAIAIYIFSYHILLPTYSINYYKNELSWDILSYYLYLPLTFIYHDLPITDFSIIENIFSTYKPSNTFYQAFQLPNGNYVLNYMNGFALLYIPFFLIGHIWAIIGGYPADGFSFPYQFSISNGVYLYIFAGLFIWRKFLLRFFDDKTTAIVMAFFLLGTNYFNEASRAQLMPHAIMFAIVALMANATVSWYESPTRRNGMILGAVFALAVLCRPSEILLGIFVMLYGIGSTEAIKNRLRFWKDNFRNAFWIVLAGIIMCIPQFIYWKIVTGSFIFFSYQNTEGFNFLEPHLVECLISFKNSWLIYTPLIIFPLTGFIMLYRKRKDLFVPIFTFTIINFYVLSSWLAWWNGGGFGMRYYVESYVLLGIPFGFLVSGLLKTKLILRIVLFPVMILLTLWNQFQTWQFANWIMPHDGRNFKFYKAVMFDTKINETDLYHLDITRTYGAVDTMKNENEYNRKTIGYFNYSDNNTSFINPDNTDTTRWLSPPSSMRLDSVFQYSPATEVPFYQLTSKDHAWIKVTVNYFPVHPMEENPSTVVITMRYIDRNFYYKGFDLEKLPYKVGEWNTATFYYLTPYPFSLKNETASIYIWHRGKLPIYFDEMKVESLEKK